MWKGKKNFLCASMCQPRHFLFTFYCFLVLEKCVSKAPCAAKLSAASLFRAADVLSKVP